ncbi:hypothetical protein [Bradyrhizobium sp. Tv2a-2]|uniref:hypothetical protein n=1 Tax=Bradyrhizobium sp. Tv2a-2 TaxID=113395 RepID=UPI000465807A|nr:hypothetical protein [Bradyrhizobium sp. Tv2a-2]
MSADLRENDFEENRLNHGSENYGLQIGPNSVPTLQLHQLSEPWPRGGRVKSAINRASKLVGLPFWRCYEIWYGRARTITQHELHLIAAAIQRKQEEDDWNELCALKTKIEILEARLNSGSQEFRGADVNQLRAQDC